MAAMANVNKPTTPAAPVRDEAGYQKGRERWAQYVDNKYVEPSFFSRAYKTLLGE